MSRGQAHEVAAAVLVRNDQVLLCHRRPDRDWFPGAWDLPGGHLHLGESALDAVIRECAEELGIEVRQPRLRTVIREPDLVMHVFIVRQWSGEVRNLAHDEHDEIAWFALPGLGDLPVVDPRLPALLRAWVAL